MEEKADHSLDISLLLFAYAYVRVVRRSESARDRKIQFGINVWLLDSSASVRSVGSGRID